MKPINQRLKIAEALGWTKFLIKPETGKWSAISPKSLVREPVPDYIKDLNAMHAAEETLTKEQRMEYGRHLTAAVHRVSGWWNLDSGAVAKVAAATAEKRAGVFLLTLGLWEDKK